MSHPLRIIYAGTPDFSVVALEALIASEHDVIAVYTQPDRPAGRGRGMQASPVKETALQHDIPVFQPESLKGEQAQAELLALNGDIMIVTAYGLLLPAAVLKTPRLGCINIHASLLPRWRGAAPIQRAILAGDKKTGITIMQMDEGLDTGAMLAVAQCDISDDDTGSSLHDKLMLLGAETLISALPEIAAKTNSGVVQDEVDTCYASKLTKAEAQIDWSLSAAEIQRAIRAYNSWPVSYCEYEKNNKSAKLRLWQAEVITQDAGSADIVAGTVIAESADTGIDVMTGEQVLRITQLQVEGKRKMSVSDFLNANSLLGQRLK
ncbi:MAG: methionyl-tRNA formyltransferase [Gammaproteobacteria bacterium]|nr:MAG: methionyl-tRNA formyltransferase [Gammaproteobacteria bacterium]